MCYHRCVMKRYNKFYNVSLGNFLKVACCSLSIITIASCAEEPFEQESSSESELLQAVIDLRTALKKSGSDISIDYLDNITSLDTQKAQDLWKNLEEIKKNKSINDEVKSLAASLWSKCKSFFGFKKEENKPTDDKSSQAEPELNIAEEWQKVEEVVDNLITKYKSLGKSDNFCDPLNSFKNMGKRLCDDDSDGELSGLKYILKDLDSDKKDKVFEDNTEVIVLINNVQSAIKAFFYKFDKSEQAGGSPSQKEQKLNKAEEWKKVDDAAQNLIQKFPMSNNNNFWAPLRSILETGKRLCDNNDSYSNFKNDLYGLKDFKFGNEDRTQLNNNKEGLALMDQVESEISAFINKFYKSEQAGDSKVSK